MQTQQATATTASRRKPVPVISQTLLASIHADRVAIAALVAEQKAIAERLRERETFVLAALQHGMRLEPGALLAALEESRRRSVSWKSAFVTALGQDAADTVLENTPETITTRLVVSDTRAQ